MATLIAGATRPELPRGDIQLADIAMRVNRFTDRPVWIYVPPSVGRFILNSRCRQVRSEGAKIWTTRNPGRMPYRGGTNLDYNPRLMNRGGTQERTPQGLFLGAVFPDYLNKVEAVRIAADQVETLKLLAELAPKTVVLNAMELDEAVRLLGTDYVIGKNRHGQQGHGKTVMHLPGEYRRHDCYQVFFPRRAEYRLVMFRDTVLTAYRKEPPPGTDPTNLHPLWHYYRIHQIRQSMVFMAQQAMQRVGLDVGGVDLIRDLDGNRLYCTEVNSAPGLGTPSVRALYAKLQETVRP